MQTNAWISFLVVVLVRPLETFQLKLAEPPEITASSRSRAKNCYQPFWRKPQANWEGQVDRNYDVHRVVVCRDATDKAAAQVKNEPKYFRKIGQVTAPKSSWVG